MGRQLVNCLPKLILGMKMSLHEHLKSRNANYEIEFTVVIKNAIKNIPYEIFKDAVLSNTKEQSEANLKAA